MNLQSGKSAGPDGWPIQLIKSVSELISIPLSIIFNKSFVDGVLPKDWKSAHVTLHQKGARNIVSNYRPVSLTSVYCNMMESIIKDHLLNHLLSNNLISPQQFGFVPSRSCTTQLLHILNYFTHHLDNGHPIDVIYLDFQKAFDSVPHQRLLQKFSSFEVHGKILMWIKDFLSNREQQVVLNGHISHSIPETSGVLQGSVLGPILFTMFVNDIPSIVLRPVYLFADDFKVFRVIKSRDDYLLSGMTLIYSITGPLLGNYHLIY